MAIERRRSLVITICLRSIVSVVDYVFTPAPYPWRCWLNPRSTLRHILNVSNQWMIMIGAEREAVSWRPGRSGMHLALNADKQSMAQQVAPELCSPIPDPMMT